MERTPASTVVRQYLDAWAERDLAGAVRFLDEGFTVVYPGGAAFTRLEDLVAHLAPRYRRVRKHFERFDEAPVENGTAVYCFGTLEGEFADGRLFEAVRFIDRFTVREGRLVDHRVWNDLPR